MERTRVEAQFGPRAAAYATSPVHARGASLQRVIELVEPQRHWHVLDVATGAGHMAAALAPHVARVVAADLTLEMLAEARKLASARGLDNFETAQADATGLPFAPASFNLVTCRIAAHHFADPRAFAAEACRVLCAGGRLALVDNVAPDRALFPQATEAELARAAASCNDFERLRDPSHARCLGLAEWQNLIAEVGFVIVHSELLAKPMEFAAWAERMDPSPETCAQLEGLLRTGTGVLRDFLAPREDDGRLLFTLHEGIIIAARPERETGSPEGSIE